MRMKYIVCSVAALLLASAAVFAGTKKAPKANFRLLEAFTQRLRQGNPSAPPPTGEHFIIVWQADTAPETFYWRGKTGFMMCMIQKAHKINKKDASKFPPGMDYRLEPTGNGAIAKGDTLEITPVARGKVRIPDEIPQNATNTLFYKTTGSGWLLFPVKKFTKKRDILAS